MICINPQSGWICTICNDAGRDHTIEGVAENRMRCSTCGRTAEHGTENTELFDEEERDAE